MSLIRYRVIHAYINKTALEFINIGVLAYTDERFGFKLMDEHSLDRLHCNIFKKESISRLLRYLESELGGLSGYEEIEKRHLYFDDFAFSREFVGKVLYDFNDEIASLYRQYVAYKFEEAAHNRRSIYEITKNKTVDIARREFGKYIDIDDSSSRVFDMLIRVKKSIYPAVYPVIIGSLENTSDINKAVKAKIYENPSVALFGYLYGIKDDKGENAKRVVSDIGYVVEDFSSDEGIKESLEALLDR